MTDRTERLLSEALKLTLEERAELATELIASVDGPSDQDATAAWTAEIERRARRALAGESTGQGWREACEDIEKRQWGN